MVFFVLSGFLVGGSVLAARQKGTWSWSGYALRRMARLWMVLIPALLLTLLWDTLGSHAGMAGYLGQYRDLYHSGPSVQSPADLRPLTLLGNALFLQTIAVNCFGTNGPLWSLANEFWYYLLFPLLVGAVLEKKLPAKAACLGLSLLLLLWLPTGILWGGVVWVLGVGAFLLAQNQKLQCRLRSPVWLVGSILLVSCLLAAIRYKQFENVGDLMLGGGVALLVASLAVHRSAPGIYSKAASASAEFSYTLYLVHFPLLSFLFFTLFKGQQLQPGLPGCLWFAGLATVVLAYAAGIWWCFERNTDRLRKALEKTGFFGLHENPSS